MKHNIVIQVIGTSGSGKTTIAEMIKELFDLYGINTEFNDPDSLSLSPDATRMVIEQRKIFKRNRTISVINSLDKITVEEIQGNRSYHLLYMNEND
jgi:ABC-type oligopeptide transport system ATPase subunit